MDLTKIKFTLEDLAVNPPEEWQGLQLAANFQDSLTSADISIEEFSFVDKARELIKNHVDQGYYFEGMPFGIQLNKGASDFVAFEGFLNLQKSLIDLSSDKYKVKIQKLRGLNTLGEKLTGLTYGYLDSLGSVQSNRIEYVVEERKPFIEVVVTGLMIYMMIKELAEIQRRVADNIADVLGGGLAGGVVLAAKIVLDLAYATLMIKAIINMTEDLLNNFISPVRKYSYCTYFELMRSACSHLGYNFESTISDLHLLSFLPSNPHDDKITSGIPRADDYGYNCAEFFSEMERKFSGSLGIIGNTVHFENKDSDFWIKQSTFKLKPVFIESKRKNGEELIGTRVISHSTDPLDQYTIQEIDGVHYEVRTDQSDYKNGEEYLTIDGVDDRFFKHALVSRKDRLNDLEKLLKELGSIVDSVINTFGGSSNLAGKIQNRVGMMKLGTDSHTVARMILVEGGKIPSNHRSRTSAKYFYENFIKADSFVLSKNGGQKEIFEGVRVLFGFENFLELLENSYFVTESGAVGKILSAKWTIDGDYAELDYWIQDPNPTTKLIERYIEPQ